MITPENDEPAQTLGWQKYVFTLLPGNNSQRIFSSSFVVFHFLLIRIATHTTFSVIVDLVLFMTYQQDNCESLERLCTVALLHACFEMKVVMEDFVISRMDGKIACS